MKEGLFLSPLFLGIGLLPFFNDFPLFPNSHFFRNASYLAVVSIIFAFIPFALNYKFTLTTAIKVYLLISVSFMLCCIILFILNHILFELYSGREYLAFLIFSKTIATLGALIFITLTLILLISSCKKEAVIEIIMKGSTFAIISSVSFGVLELLAQLPQTNFIQPIYHALDNLFHDNFNNYFGTHSVRSLAFEPSYLSLPIAFLLPFALLRAYLKKGIFSKSLVLGLFLLVIMSGSRSALLATIIQTLFFFYG